MSEPSALAFPDYSQTCFDHRRLLVLVRSVSPTSLRPKTFARVVEVLDRGARVQVKSAEDVTRQVEVRFVRSYPVENNEWGEFQHHRAVLGLISVGCYRTHQEYGELGRLHETIKLKYSKYLLCSRLIALKDNQNESNLENGGDGDGEEEDCENGGGGDGDDDESRLSSCATSPHCRLEYLQDLDEKTLEADMGIFLSTMFWLLEKARVEKKALESGGQSYGKVPLLCAPFERRDFVGLDMESRVNRRRTLGRFRKHLGDLSLMCGLLREAYDYYEQAADVLKSCNDWLWLANSLEGVCSISTMVHYPGVNRDVGLRRNSSVQALNSGGLGVAVSQLRRVATAVGSDGKKMLKGERDEKQKSPARGMERDEAFAKRVITTQELVEHTRDIVVHYSKYRHAGLIETEASVKAVQMLLEQSNVLLAAEYLQNIVFINLQMNDEEKVHRFSALSRLYGLLGMRRKAAFFHRVAAMRCVAPQNPQTDWAACYGLLLKALPGYNVNFQQAGPTTRRSGRVGRSERPPHPSGWPVLQIQIMQELVGTSRRMGDHTAATRHMAFLIQAFFTSLRERDRAEMCHQLAILTAKSPGTPVSHAVEAGLLLPPVNIYTVPLVTGFSPCPLPESLIYLSPTSSAVGSGEEDGPFIFTPIQASAASDSKAINWVQGEVACLELLVTNPLAVELRVEDMSVMHEGAEFDAFPSSLVLKPGVGPQKIKLSGIPQEAGELRILGYSCVVFGIRSHCRTKCLGLADFEDREFHLVKVSPSLPKLELTISGVDEPVETLPVEVYHGEEAMVEICLLNSSNLAVERLKTTCQGVPIKFRKNVGLAEKPSQEIEPGYTALVRVKVSGPPTKCDYQVPKEGLENIPEEQKQQAQLDSFPVQVVTKFSGATETSQGYFRQLTQRLQVTLLPSVMVSWWDVLPGESGDECYLVLDVCNLAEAVECELTYGDGKHIVVDAGGKCRIPIPASKVPCDAMEKQSGGSGGGGGGRMWERRREKFLAEYLDEHVDLKWRMQDGSSSRSGRVSLAGLELDSRMAERLQLSPVSWTASLNGELWHGADFSAPAGDPMALEVSVDNHYDGPVRCRFRVEAGYVTQPDGGGDDSPRGISHHPVSVSGSARDRRGCCDPGGSVGHRCVLLATTPGRVRVRCFCDVFKKGPTGRGGGGGGEETKVDSLAIPDFFVNLS